jgi:alpha-L-rhamnosidase
VLSRRIFIKNSSLGLGLLWAFPRQTLARASLYSRFQNPSAEAKPFMRWWWNGNCVTAAEIEREIQIMHQAGIGGVEINPLEMPEYVTQPSEGKPLIWMSDEYRQMLKVAITEVRRLGMEVDLIIGTGWPFGGQFIEPSETLQGIRTEIKKISLSNVYEGNIGFVPNENQRLFQIKLVPQNCTDIAEVLDIDADAQGNYRIEGQPGEYDLFVLIWQNKFRNVLHGSLGGDGPVLDHFNANAVQKYLNRMSDALKKTFGNDLSQYFRAFFCDSIELNGANWTGDFSEQFYQRRGYAVEPYLCWVLNEKATILEKLRVTIERVRYDYSQTMSELFMERFVKVFHQWCRQNGVKSRYQAYGFPSLYNPMIDGFAVPDIPEGDQWLFSNSWQPYNDIDNIRYAIWNKYASSAGHQQGRRIISSEAMTNTAGVFRESLGYIKQATDLNFITGINHLILHGFNYSPPSAGFPGWVRFGSYFNEQSPWWQYMPLYSTYTARLSQLMQDTQAVSKVGILGPTADVWAKYGTERNAFNGEPWYLHNLWQALNSNGYTADYVSEKLIQEASIKNQTLACGWQQYEMLLVIKVQSLSPKTFQQLEKYAQQGGKLVFVEQYPSALSGLQIDNEYPSRWTSLASHLIEAPSIKSLAGVAGWAQKWLNAVAVAPNVRLGKPSTLMFFIHRKNDQTEVLFFSNLDTQNTISTDAMVESKYKNASVWNPETGEKSRLTLKNGRFNINLQPLQSLLIVFDNQPAEKQLFISVKRISENQIIEGVWKVQTKAVSGQKSDWQLEKLTDFLAIPDWKNFSGEIIYRIDFKVNNPASFKQLHLGKVHETAEVWLNDKALGICWYGCPIFDLKNQLKKGRNTLKIKVTTTLYNFIAAQTDHPATQFWQAKTKHKAPMSTGLLGPVQLG